MLKRFRESTAAMPDGTVVLDPNRAIEWWNPAAQRLLSLNYPGDVGRRIGNLVRHPAFQAYLEKGNFKRAVEIPAPGNDAVTLALRMVPYGKNRTLLTVRDITRLRYLERVRQDFVANVSHELRTPLTVISGYLESMAEDADELPPRWRRTLEAMRAQAERMGRIVTDLLTLSRLEADHRMSNPEPVDMGAVVDRVCAEARALSGEQVHRIDCQADRGLWLLGDEGELHSLVSNLVFNAVRYTPAGGSIVITWAADAEGARLAVRDTGIGIAQQHIPRLTERFYRVDVGRSRDQGGTGLGLAIVKHILARHRGRLEIESEPGKGSLFCCRFPADRLVEAPRREATG
jgi:two-component system phosphate regulon sensor histidine kinase PhoR